MSMWHETMRVDRGGGDTMCAMCALASSSSSTVYRAHVHVSSHSVSETHAI